MLNEHRLIADCFLNRWSIIVLNNQYTVNNSASLDMQQWMLCTVPTSPRQRQHLMCASALSMALLFTPTQSLTLHNYTNYWQHLTTARCLGTLNRLRTWTVDSGLEVGTRDVNNHWSKWVLEYFLAFANQNSQSRVSRNDIANKTKNMSSKLGLVRFLNRNRNRGFWMRKTETAISPCIRDDFLPETLKFPTSAVSKYMKFNSL